MLTSNPTLGVGVLFVLGAALTTMWPCKHILDLLRLRSASSSSARPRPHSATAAAAPSWGPLSPSGVKGMHYGDIFYAAVGLAAYYFTWPDPTEARELPRPRDFIGSWVCMVLVRNLCFEVPFYEFWHQLLFGALATDSITQHRYSEHSPYESRGDGKPQMSVWRERFWCTGGFVWSTVWECAIVHAWASGRIPACDGAHGLRPPSGTAGSGPLGLGCQMRDPSSAAELLSASGMAWLLWFVLGFPLTTQWRGVHFFAVHRGMHPWWHIRRSVWDGDLGATLYRHVHSLHHKSFNPGPWSSLSMHPVEHIFYFSCFALAFVVPYHPLHLLCNKYHTDLSALAGHDGYGDPGADDVGHYLHHKHFECNYGFSFPNYLDRMFGTFEDGSKWDKRAKAPAADDDAKSK